MKTCYFCFSSTEDEAEYCPDCGRSMQVDVPVHHLRPGYVLENRYMIGRALGEGGFGITYIGWDQRLRRKIAIKEYYPGSIARRTDGDLVTSSVSGNGKLVYDNGKMRFLQEAQLLAGFADEPGIVSVHDFFEENQTAYIVMEYLEGQTLREYLRAHGTISFRDTIAMLRPVMESLQHVHSQGLIHRDISPDNIMITGRGVKLLDFGAARGMSTEENRSISVMLKPGFAPAEQYMTHGEQGAWTDVYALCATVYKCITGKAPQESTQRLLEDRLAFPSQLGAAISEPAERCLMRGLALRKEDRYCNIGALLADLDDTNLLANVDAFAMAPNDSLVSPVFENGKSVYGEEEPVTSGVEYASEDKTVGFDASQTAWMQINAMQQQASQLPQQMNQVRKRMHPGFIVGPLLAVCTVVVVILTTTNIQRCTSERSVENVTAYRENTGKDDAGDVSSAISVVPQSQPEVDLHEEASTEDMTIADVLGYPQLSISLVGRDYYSPGESYVEEISSGTYVLESDGSHALIVFRFRIDNPTSEEVVFDMLSKTSGRYKMYVSTEKKPYKSLVTLSESDLSTMQKTIPANSSIEAHLFFSIPIDDAFELPVVLRIENEEKMYEETAY